MEKVPERQPHLLGTHLGLKGRDRGKQGRGEAGVFQADRSRQSGVSLEGAGEEAGGAGLPDSATPEGRGGAGGRGQGAGLRGPRRSGGGAQVVLIYKKAGSRRLGPRPLTRPPAKTRRSPRCSRAARRCRPGALFSHRRQQPDHALRTLAPFPSDGGRRSIGAATCHFLV